MLTLRGGGCMSFYKLIGPVCATKALGMMTRIFEKQSRRWRLYREEKLQVRDNLLQSGILNFERLQTAHLIWQQPSILLFQLK